MKIKVCGLTRTKDVSLAADLGADLLGFVVAKSPRSVELEALPELVSHAPATALTVAVVVNPEQATVDRLLEIVDRVQFHGDESPEFCARYGRRALKAFRIREPEDVARVQAYEDSVGAFLLDSFKKGVAGGTGHTFTWSYLKGHRFNRPTLLAGGLNPGNAAQAGAVPEVQGLDLSSGLEASPGIKDPQLMRDFFAEVQQFRT